MGWGVWRRVCAGRETATVAALCAAWYALSSASNVVGKLALTVFPFPLSVALLQLLASAALTGPALAACGVRAGRHEPGWRVLMPLAAAKFLTTLFSQVSIWKVPVSYAHTVKATTPLWTAGLAWLVWGERVGGRVGGALVLIAGGVGVASVTELQWDALGLGAALGAAALLSAQHLYSKRVLRLTGVHHLRLLRALSARALLLAAPLWAWRDGAALWAGGGGGGTGVQWAECGPLLAAHALLAWLQAVAAFSVLSRVSPLTYGVASAAKRAAVVAASLLLLRNPAPPANVAGMALAAAGVLLYNRARATAPHTASHTATTSHSLYSDKRPLLPV